MFDFSCQKWAKLHFQKSKNSLFIFEVAKWDFWVILKHCDLLSNFWIFVPKMGKIALLNFQKINLSFWVVKSDFLNNFETLWSRFKYLNFRNSTSGKHQNSFFHLEKISLFHHWRICYYSLCEFVPWMWCYAWKIEV